MFLSFWPSLNYVPHKPLFQLSALLSCLSRANCVCRKFDQLKLLGIHSSPSLA